jgi:CheY-like chemotaxis protein
MNKILIVEDDDFLSKMQKITFSAEGYQVEIAGDGLKAIQLVDSFNPDVVVLDLILPGVDGIEIMKHIRFRDQGKNIPIIVFSNFNLKSLVENTGDSWANYSLTKASCTRKQLVGVVQKLLAEARSAPLRMAATQPRGSALPAEMVALGTNAGLRQVFLNSVPGTIGTLRNLLQHFVKSEKEDRRNAALDLYLIIHSLNTDAALVGFNDVANFCSAFEGLLKDLYENPEYINPSTTRTVAQSIDFLPTLLERAKRKGDGPAQVPQILIVDDEPIARLTINYALQKARLKSKMVGNSIEALKAVEETHFDLIILDVNMPGMNGFELCAKLRSLPSHQKTPILFITCMTDLESRARSSLSGGNEFIAKPFLLIELTVKALTYILRNQP